MPSQIRRSLPPLVLAVAALACQEVESAEPARTAVVATRDIRITATAAGTVAPITTVEVKSQASGEIVEVQVDEGEEVKRGQLLVRVDPRIQQNAVQQAEADSVVAAAALDNAESRLARSTQLHREQAITDEEFENARLARATAYADLMRAQRALEDARIAFVQTEVRAPSAGIILGRTVEVGSVIASASRDVGGGTVLMRMATLDTVEVRALVDERDIGRIRAGLPVTITVSAFPNRPFEGEVLRVGAEAVIEQNVTTFPVLVRIPNRAGLLKPGMNAEVQIRIGEALGTLAVPSVALRDVADVKAVATFLGFDGDSLQRALNEGPGAGNLVAFVAHGDAVRAVRVQGGLTDFDWTQVEGGLAAGDTVLVLPTSGLLADQARREEWVRRRVGGPLGNN